MQDWAPVSQVLGFSVSTPPPVPSQSSNLSADCRKETFTTWIECPRLLGLERTLLKLAASSGVKIEIQTDRGLVREKLFLEIRATKEERQIFKERLENEFRSNASIRHPRWLDIPCNDFGVWNFLNK